MYERPTVSHQLRHIFSKETKGWVSYHHVRLLENLDAFLAAKIPIPFQRRLHIVRESSLAGSKVGRNDFHFVGLATGFVMGGDEFFQAEEEEVHLEILPEVRILWVIAVTEDDLISEEITVMVQFLFNVAELCVEFVIFGRFCGVQVFVCQINLHGTILPLLFIIFQYSKRHI